MLTGTGLSPAREAQLDSASAEAGSNSSRRTMGGTITGAGGIGPRKRRTAKRPPLLDQIFQRGRGVRVQLAGDPAGAEGLAAGADRLAHGLGHQQGILGSG